MPTVNISLPDPLKEFVDEQVASGRYGSASEYLQELIQEDEKRRAKERLKALLLEGLESGDPIELGPEFWEQQREELLARHRKVRK